MRGRGRDGGPDLAVSCGDVRVAVSAMIDGEDPGLPVVVVRRHLGGCDQCRDWRAGAERVSRLVRVRSAEPVPDLTARVLAAVHVDDAVARRREAQRTHQALASAGIERHFVQGALAMAAMVQLLFAVPVLWEGFVGNVGVGHMSREIASVDVAVAVGFLLVAWRPERAGTYLPVAVVLAACMALTTVVDVVNGRADPIHEAGHVIVVAQAGLLWMLARLCRPVRRVSVRSLAR